MSKTYLAVALIVLAATAAYLSGQDNKSNVFQTWKQTHGVKYDTSLEEQYRRMIFQRNVEIIEAHNADSTQTYKMGINQFSALTDEQFVTIYLTPLETYPVADAGMDMSEPNADIDWTAKGMVSGVKNQGSCGSCWAFSATGAMESHALIKGQRVSLSEQQLVDCSSAQGNHGCNGGWPLNAMKYTVAHGSATQSEYPYVARTEACKKTGGSFKITSTSTASGCTGIQNALNGRPLSVAVDATNWNKYSSGIFNNCAGSINHAVLLVGLSSTYWKIKNSWGTSWGERGYIRLTLGNTCGICNHQAAWPN